MKRGRIISASLSCVPNDEGRTISRRVFRAQGLRYLRSILVEDAQRSAEAIEARCWDTYLAVSFLGRQRPPAEDGDHYRRRLHHAAERAGLLRAA